MLVFVSTSEDGRIDRYRLDSDTGLLTPLGSTAVGKLVMPMAVVSQGRPRLYAAVRSLPSSINTFDIDVEQGALSPTGPATSLTDNKVYLSIDNTGRYLFTASFAGNNFAVFRLTESGLPEAQPRQVLPIGGKAHCIIPDRTNRFVYAINFGEGRILSFLFDAETGRLTPTAQAEVAVDLRVGVRVAVISPDNRFLYVIYQYSGEIAQFEIDQRTGALRHIGDTLFVQPDMGLAPGVMHEHAAEANSTGAVDGDVARIWASDLKITPNGRFLYATERTRSAIVLLQRDAETGVPRYVARFPAERQPRGIAIDPSGRWLVAAGEKSDRLSVFAIDRQYGQLRLLERYGVGRGANWVDIVDAP